MRLSRTPEPAAGPRSLGVSNRSQRKRCIMFGRKAFFAALGRLTASVNRAAAQLERRLGLDTAEPLQVEGPAAEPETPKGRLKGC